jgi:hypothetical protein
MTSPPTAIGKMRDAFVAACVAEVAELGLAGLNFDFEFPECGKPAMPHGVPRCSAAGQRRVGWDISSAASSFTRESLSSVLQISAPL